MNGLVVYVSNSFSFFPLFVSDQLVAFPRHKQPTRVPSRPIGNAVHTTSSRDAITFLSADGYVVCECSDRCVCSGFDRFADIDSEMLRVYSVAPIKDGYVVAASPRYGRAYEFKLIVFSLAGEKKSEVLVPYDLDIPLRVSGARIIGVTDERYAYIYPAQGKDSKWYLVAVDVVTGEHRAHEIDKKYVCIDWDYPCADVFGNELLLYSTLSLYPEVIKMSMDGIHAVHISRMTLDKSNRASVPQRMFLLGSGELAMVVFRTQGSATDLVIERYNENGDLERDVSLRELVRFDKKTMLERLGIVRRSNRRVKIRDFGVIGVHRMPSGRFLMSIPYYLLDEDRNIVERGVELFDSV